MSHQTDMRSQDSTMRPSTRYEEHDKTLKDVRREINTQQLEDSGNVLANTVNFNNIRTTEAFKTHESSKFGEDLRTWL